MNSDEANRANGGPNLPNKGTETNVTTDYGADLGGEARNRIAGIGRSTRSDPPEACKGGRSA